MMMSPGSTSSASSSITASVGPPAFTMIRIFRGTASDATKSADDSDGTNVPSPPCSSISASVLAYDRLCTAVTNPLRAKLRARFDPITARPVTPISAFGVVQCRSLPSLRDAGMTVRTSPQPSAPRATPRGGVGRSSRRPADPAASPASGQRGLDRGGDPGTVGAARRGGLHLP